MLSGNYKKFQITAVRIGVHAYVDATLLHWTTFFALLLTRSLHSLW